MTQERGTRLLPGLSSTVLWAGVVSFLMDVSSEMIYPLVPLFMVQSLGARTSTLGLIEGIAESTASILKVFSGWISDRMGRRKLLMTAGYGTSAGSRIILPLAGAWHHVLLFRFVDRLGKGIRTAPRDALIAESTDPSCLGRAFGFHRAMDTLGAVVGPALALLIMRVTGENYRTVFMASILPAVAAVVVILLFIRERRSSQRSELPPPRLTFREFDGRLKLFLLAATLFALGNSSDVFLILKAREVGIPVMLIPALHLTFNVIYALGAVPAGMIADRYGKRRVILAGFLLFALLYGGFAVASSPETVWLLFPAYGLFMALTEGIQKAFIASIAPPAVTATAFGVHATLVGLATLPASLVGGILWEKVSPAATFLFGSTTALGAAAIFILLCLRYSGRGGPLSPPQEVQNADR